MTIRLLRNILSLCVFVFGCVYLEYRLYALVALSAFLLWNVFQKDFRIQQGSKQRKRKTEVFLLSLLLSLLGVLYFQWIYLYLLYFPIVVMMLFYSLKYQSIVLNYLILLAHLKWLYPEYFVVSAVAISTWTLFSFVIVMISRQKFEKVKRKLSVLERESRKYLQETEEDLFGIEQRRVAQAADRIGQEKEQFHNLTQILFEMFIPHTCAFYVYEPCENIFILKSHQTQADDFDSHSLMPCEGIFKLVQTQRRTMQIHDNAIPGMLFYKNKKNIKTVLVCPLVEDDRLHGVFIIDHIENKTYHNHEISVIERIVKHFYNIIKDSKTIAQFEHLKQEFSSFYQASSALNRAFHLQEVLETLLHMAKTIAPYDWGTIVLYNKDIDKNMVVLDSNQDQHGLVGQTFALEYQKGLVSWVIDQMKPLHYNNFTQKYRHSPLFHAKLKVPNLYESALVLPLYVQDEKIGAMVLMSEKNFFFTRIIQNMLEVMVFQAAIAIKNAISVGHLEKLATTDGLTGLINHRTFQDELSQELQRAGRFNQEMTVMLLDLDFFKKINDEFGHPAGDVILKKTAAFLTDQVRNTDLVARYGGEEFAIILPNTSSDAAARLAKRMIDKIHHQKWMYENIHIPVTFSIGVASFPENAKDKSVLIEHADQALYHAKNSGRDRVCVFHKEMMIKDPNFMESKLIESIEKQVRT